jgi:transposase-like protein
MTTQFYSTKVNKNVNIPNTKVCGYRVKNYATKKGWSSSLKAGRDNQYNQKFHRFSSDWEAEDKHKCEGNRNWLNKNQRMEFNGTREGVPFELKRPAFRAGMSYIQNGEAQNIDRINERSGLGNREIKRPAFLSPDIKPRQVIDFDKLQALDIEQAGQKVQLGESTLKKLFEVAMPDTTDTKWIAEKARLTALYRRQGMTDAQIARELEVNKPLGREQRTTKEKRNIGASNLSMADKLKEIKEEVDAGNAQSRAQQAVLTGQLALVLNDTNAIAALTQAQLQGLGQALARIGVPTQHKRLGLIPRFVDITFYNANAGMINLLLFSKVRETPNTIQYNYDRMVRNFAGNPAQGLPAMTLQSAVSAMGRGGANRRYLDLGRGGVITRNQLRAAANAQGGFAGNADFDIQPANQ